MNKDNRRLWHLSHKSIMPVTEQSQD